MLCVERLAILILEAVFAVENNGKALWFNILENCLLPSAIRGTQKINAQGCMKIQRVICHYA